MRALRHRLLHDDPDFVPEEGTREIEIADVTITADGGGRDEVRPGEGLAIAVELSARSPVPDVEVSFEVVSAETNHPVLSARTSTLGTVIGPVEEKKRVRFWIPPAPWPSGRYFVTVGLAAADGHAYHVRTQYYPLVVPSSDALPAPLTVRPRVEVEEL